MVDYTLAIYAVVGITIVLTAGIAFVLAQPTDLPVLKDPKD